MGRRIAALAVCLAAAGAGGLRVARAADPAPRRAQDDVVAAREALVERLHELATWCSRNRLYLARLGVWEEILTLAPDDEAAHEGLGHTRKRSGEWVAGKPSRPPKNYDDEALEELPAQRAAAVAPYSAQLVQLAARADLPFAVHWSLLEDVVAVDPDNASARAMRGEVRSDAGWVLVESELAETRRGAIRDAVRDAYKRTPRPTEVEPSAKDAAIGLKWAHCVATDTVRVLGTGADEKETTMTARALHVAPLAFNAILGTKAKLGRSMSVYLLADAEREKSVFLDHHPDVGEVDRPMLEQLEGSGFHASSDFAHWAPEASRRTDASVRFGIGWLLYDAFEIDTSDGWAYEGLGLYLTRELIGTRLSWFVLPSRLFDESSDAALRAKLLDPETNWMNEANVMLAKEGSPALSAVLDKTVNELTTEDLLYAYVFAAYVVEGRSAEQARALLTAIGRGASARDAVRGAFDTTLEALDVRVRRWLGERR